MCGIIGMFGASRAAFERALDSVRHRGPDGLASLEANGWQLGHARLAILDPSPRSNQPFVGRRGSALVYNGELWNFRAVRAELEALGERFNTEGDTEVLSAALETWGIEATLPKLEWMGVFAWLSPGTGAAQRLFLARDRFGEVPLAVSRDGTAFASERKALLGVASDVEELPPGTWCELPGGTAQKWYDPPSTPISVGAKEACENVREL